MQKYSPLLMAVCITFLTFPLSSCGFTILPSLTIKACSWKFQNSINKDLHLMAMSQMLVSSSKLTFATNNHSLSMSSLSKRASFTAQPSAEHSNRIKLQILLTCCVRYKLRKQIFACSCSSQQKEDIIEVEKWSDCRCYKQQWIQMHHCCCEVRK